MAWYKVLSMTPVSVDHQNGASVSYPRGKVFQADVGNPDVRRLLSLSPPRIIGMPDPVEIESHHYEKPSGTRPMPPAESPVKSPKNLPPGIHEIVKIPRPAERKG